MSSDELLAAIDGYYTDKVLSHGPTPQGVDWNGAQGQERRFDELLAILPAEPASFSLNDFGCGYGALLERLSLSGRDFDYVGYDVSSAMVEQARARCPTGSSARFTTELSELPVADFTVASGIFNVRLDVALDQWADHLHQTLEQMVRLSGRGIAFNALTSHSDADRKRPDLYYADPAALLDDCLRNYSRDVELRHNYELYEFTMLVWLGRRPPASPRLQESGNE